MYIQKHWRGALSLPISFWINFCGFNAAYGLLTGWWFGKGSHWFASSLSPQIAFTISAVVALLLPVLLVWQYVGVWRSAGNAVPVGMRFWPVVTRITLVLAFIFVCFSIWQGVQEEMARTAMDISSISAG